MNSQPLNIPAPNSIVIFRGDDGKVYFLNSLGKVYLTESYHGVHRIVNPSFTYWHQITGEQIEVIKSTPQEFIFALYRSTQTVISRGGGKKGISGLIIEDEDVSLGSFQILNFEGANVIVTNDGGGKATVTIGGGGMITGAGTPNRLAMFTAPNVIGDSPFLRSGNDVIADAFLYFNSGFGIDVLASGGADVLNIGTTNADVINYGYAGTTHNMNGTVFNVFTTNLNVTDKIITLNDGGAAGSGGNVGFEIEEGGVATGYFIQNTTRDGFDFQASAVTGVATFDLSLLTGNQTATLQDASGIIAYLSDIPAPINGWLLDGNTTAGEYIGTNNAQPFPIRTNAILAGTVSSTQLWSIGGAAPIAGVRMLITGTTNDNTAFALRVDNTTLSDIFTVRNDGYISAGVSDGSLTIGLLSGFNPTGSSGNTFVGVSIATSTLTSSFNSGFGNLTFGSGALTGSGENSGFGFGVMFRLSSGAFNTAMGSGALDFITTGSRNVAIGRGAGTGFTTTSSDNTVIGNGTSPIAGTKNQNTIIGSLSGMAIHGDANIFLGYASGTFETGSNTLMIDNQARASEADARIKALLYGIFNASPALQEFHINAKFINVDDLQVGNAGIASGYLYVDTAVNILSNADLIVARKV